MKVMRVLSSAALLVALTASMAFAHNTSSDRLERREMGRSERAWQGQQFGQRHGNRFGQRYGQGQRLGGQLTWWEAARLRQGQAQIRQMERLARADGIVTWRERRMIQRAKMQQMQLQYRFRHNGRTA